MTFSRVRIPCVFMRAGTSRGAFFLSRDLPDDPEIRDTVILAAYGSPDSRQIDGLGGADPLTSKVAVVGPGDRGDADVTYTFGQVGIEDPRIYWVGNCGNMSAGVGPFAVNIGLVEAREPTTYVRIYNTNTDRVLTAAVPVHRGAAVEDGETVIAGVPGSGARIDLDFGRCGGAVLGAVLPTGEPVDHLAAGGATVAVSVVDATTPFVFVAAGDVGMAGTELPDVIRSDPELLGRLESIRSAAARLTGFVSAEEDATRRSPSIPRISVVSPPRRYCTTSGSVIEADQIDVVVRQMSMQRPHQTYAVTGTLCTGVASLVAGSVVDKVAGTAGPSAATVRLGHPGGIILADVAVSGSGRDVAVERACLPRTASTIMDGHVHVSATRFEGRQPA